MAGKANSKKRRERRRRQQAVWLAGAMPLEAYCSIVVLVDRQSGEPLGSQLVRSPGVAAAIDGLVQAASANRAAPRKLYVDDHELAIELRTRLRGIAVSDEWDSKTIRLLGGAVGAALEQLEPTTLTLTGGEPVYTLKVSLRDSEPPIWRRIRIAGDVTLEVLHSVLQAAMGWENAHLHSFRIGDVEYGMYTDHSPADELPEDEAVLNSVLPRPGAVATYTYDFGDSWVHHLEVESVAQAAPGEPIAACVGGARACPPEDCGGMSGYERVLAERARDGDDDDSWLPENFDPEAFDRAAANDWVQGLFVVTGEIDDDAYADGAGAGDNGDASLEEHH